MGTILYLNYYASMRKEHFKQDMLSLVSLKHKHLFLSPLLASSRCVSQLLFSPPPRILPLPWLDRLPSWRFWLAHRLREHCRAVSVSYWDEAALSLFQVHTNVHVCRLTHTHTHSLIFLLFTPKHSNVMLLNLNNWNGVISAHYSPK